MNLAETRAEWVWTENLTGENIYADFITDFFLSDTAARAQLLISADSDYALYINGVFADAGHYDDFPDKRTFDSIDVARFLNAGKNRIAVLGYYQGRASHQYYPGEPGIIFALMVNDRCVACSGSHTKARPDAIYKSAGVPTVTGQLGFSFEADAGRDDGWLNPDYDASAWGNALIRSMDRLLSPRPTEKLLYKAPPLCRIAAQGRYLRRNQYQTVAQTMFNDYLSPLRPDEIFDGGIERLPFSCRAYIGKEPVALKRPAFDGADGVYLVLDLGREEAGLLTLDIQADGGTVFDIAWGQHLDDLRVRSFVNRNFAARYIARSGRQQFMFPFKRLGARYLQVHINRPAVLYSLTVIPWEYPVAHKGAFNCSDSLHNRIWEVSRRTLELCMHEHYEDTPWREQAFYVADSRNQALCGYYAFGEYRFPAACFELYQGAFEGPLYADICAPSKSGLCIPSFVLLWPLTVYEQYLYSGDAETAKKTWPRIKALAEELLLRTNDGLMPTPGQHGMWNFYEWAEELGGDMNFGPDREISRFEAPLQLFALQALLVSSKLADALGEDGKRYLERAEALRTLINRAFLHPDGVYATYLDGETQSHFCQLTQALALLLGVVPEHMQSSLRDRLLSDDSLIPTTLAYSLFKYEALLSGGEKYARPVFDEIGEKWGYMLYHGATSFWETLTGADDFDFAGSLCHGWSAVPLYLYMRYCLGVRPAEPGFRSFDVLPVTPFETSEGDVPTPYGTIHIKVSKTPDNMRVSVRCPDGAICRQSGGNNGSIEFTVLSADR